MSEQREDLQTALTRVIFAALGCLVVYAGARAASGAVLPFIATMTSASVGLLLSGSLKRLKGDKLATGRFKNVVTAIRRAPLWQWIAFDPALRVVLAVLFGVAVALVTLLSSSTLFARIEPDLLRDSLSMLTVTFLAWTLVNAVTASRVGVFWSGLGEAIRVDLNVESRPVDEWIAQKTGGSRDRINRWLNAAVAAFLRAFTATVGRALLVSTLPLVVQNTWLSVALGAAALLAVAFPRHLAGLIDAIRQTRTISQSSELPHGGAASGGDVENGG